MQNTERIINKKRTAIQCKDTDILDMLMHVLFKNADEVWMFKGKIITEKKVVPVAYNIHRHTKQLTWENFLFFFTR